MKKLASLMLLLLSNYSYAAGPKDALESFHAALTAGDKAAAIDLLAPDITIYESGFVERSKAEYADHHLAGDIAFAKTSSRKVLRQGERVDGNIAVLWEETETTGKSQGKDVHVFGTETALLQKKDEKWTIVHVHWSSRKAK